MSGASVSRAPAGQLRFKGARRTARSTWLALGALSLLAVSGVLAGPARSTVPGSNGLLAATEVTDRDCTNQSGPCSQSRLVLAHPGGGDLRILSACEDPDCVDRTPVWSPDGRWLAFSRGEFAALSEVYVMRPDGSELRKVADGFSPSWSPDGQRLVFARDVKGNFGPCCASREELFIVGRDGTGVRRLTFRGGRQPDWGSSNRIAFVRSRSLGRGDVYTVLPDGRTLRRLTRGGRAERPSWSPFATKLAVADYRARRSVVRVISPRGRPLGRIATGGAFSPVWSPDGRRIAFSRENSTFITRSSTRRGRRGFRRACARCVGPDWQPRPR